MRLWTCGPDATPRASGAAESQWGEVTAEGAASSSLLSRRRSRSFRHAPALGCRRCSRGLCPGGRRQTDAEAQTRAPERRGCGNRAGGVPTCQWCQCLSALWSSGQRDQELINRVPFVLMLPWPWALGEEQPPASSDPSHPTPRLNGRGRTFPG